MNKKIGIIIFTFFIFLLWLYLAIYKSSIDSWWTVNEIEQTSFDTAQVSVSMAKVLIGTVIFTFCGFIIYFLIRKRK
ncbi:hypothetical protein [Virgibacillus sp. JSM 102003]|uniref:hypothetical protein n=1 Tax=Virgibacillus sp. JSM 102003 TaxID=1562108 RepID=UPI0035BF3E64